MISAVDFVFVATETLYYGDLKLRAGNSRMHNSPKSF